MAIRDYFRVSLRKQSIVTRDDASTSTGHDSNSSGKSNKSGNRLKLAKSFSWKTRSDSSGNSSTTDASGDSSKMVNTLDRPEKGVPSWLKKKNQPQKGKKGKKGGKEDPREKPLTLENIQHQEMLSAFTWTFGNRASFDGRSINGVSPGTSRMPSFDAGSRPLPPGSGGDGDDSMHHPPHHMRHGHAPHQPSLLSPDSAAYGRRAAVHCSD